MLTSDLDGQEEKDRACVERLLRILVTELEMDKPDTSNICQRSNKREVHLVIIQFLSKSEFYYDFISPFILRIFRPI